MPKSAKLRTAFAKQLSSIRNSKGISQRELAKLTGVSQRVIALYETIIKNPTPDLVVRIAKSLDVSIDELMGHKTIKIKENLDRKTIKKARMIAELPLSDQKTILRHIEDLKAKYKK